MKKITILVILLSVFTMLVGCSSDEAVDTAENTPSNIITDVLNEAGEYALVIDKEPMKQIKVNRRDYFSKGDKIQYKKGNFTHILVEKKIEASDKYRGIQKILPDTTDFYIGTVTGAVEGKIKINRLNTSLYTEKDFINKSPIEMAPGDYLFVENKELVIVRYTK